MILGTGIDLIEVARIAASFEKFGERFVNRILLPAEIAYCLSHKRPAPFLAVRFAAKEAVSKAFGTGIGAALGWQDIEIRRRESGEPFVVLHGRGQELFEARGATRKITPPPRRFWKAEAERPKYLLAFDQPVGRNSFSGAADLANRGRGSKIPEKSYCKAARSCYYPRPLSEKPGAEFYQPLTDNRSLYGSTY